MRVAREILIAGLVTGLIGIQPFTAVAQSTENRTVEQFSCRDVMRESGQSRDTAIAFLHGFILGKAGQSDFNVEELSKQTDAFIDHCLDNPKDTALEAMMKVKAASN